MSESTIVPVVRVSVLSENSSSDDEDEEDHDFDVISSPTLSLSPELLVAVAVETTETLPQQQQEQDRSSNVVRRPNRRTRNRKRNQQQLDNDNGLKLRDFSCPFLDEFGTCIYDELPQHCHFSHPEMMKPGQTLMKIPFYVCVYYLIHICNFRPKRKKNRNSGPNNSSSDEPDCCNYGYHLKLHTMHDFQYKFSDLIIDQFGSDLDLECELCHKKVVQKCFTRNRRFGLLENCFHIFCATCLIAHRRTDQTKQCPVCGVVSKRMANYRKFVGSLYTKATIFTAMPLNEVSSSAAAAISNAGDETFFPVSPEPPSTDLLPRPPASLSSNLHRSTPISPLVQDFGNLTISQIPVPGPSSEKIVQKCQLCSKNITAQKLKFGLLENCEHQFCLACIEQERTKSFKCPVCKLTSRRMVPNSGFVPSSKEKGNLFFKLNGTTGFLKTSFSTSSTLVSGQSPTPPPQLQQPQTSTPNNVGVSSNLLCRICNQKVKSNPRNSDRKFGILENCWHVFCSSCIEPKHSESPQCPVCKLTSRRIFHNTEFVQSNGAKQKLFAKLNDRNTNYNRGSPLGLPPGPSTPNPTPTTPNVDQQLNCGICNQKVKSNPRNPCQKFGILENCCHVFCSPCIEPKHIESPKCPVCKLTSRRIFHNSEFVQAKIAKQNLFLKLNVLSSRGSPSLSLSSTSTVPPDSSSANANATITVDNHQLICGICNQKVLSNLFNPDRKFGILQNCCHVFCSPCINQKRFLTQQCPICKKTSRRIVHSSRFVQSEGEKRKLFENNISNKVLTKIVVNPSLKLNVKTKANEVNKNNFLCLMCNKSYTVIPGGNQFVCLLEGCSHVFCMECICPESDPFHCRQCGVQSERFSIQSRIGHSAHEKMALFNNSNFFNYFNEIL